MQLATLKAQTRTETGSGAARRLRRGGRIPAILYGHTEGPVSILLGEDEVKRIVAHRIKMVQLAVDEKTEQVLVRDVQFDTFGDEVLHVDFERVAMDELIEVECPVELVGTSKGQAAGGVVEHPVSDLKISCLPGNIPDAIKVSISNLVIGDVIHVREITAPEGVTILTDPESILVTIRPPAKVEEAVPAAAPAEGAAAEPEVIRREKPEDEAEEADA